MTFPNVHDRVQGQDCEVRTRRVGFLPEASSRTLTPMVSPAVWMIFLGAVTQRHVGYSGSGLVCGLYMEIQQETGSSRTAPEHRQTPTYRPGLEGSRSARKKGRES
jgi:hypothetical protein